jgi:nucleotide-binding universal stress UspA family protein
MFLNILVKTYTVKKILVPTDFSEYSKAGLRFAMQWSTVEKIELVFIHVLHISRPTQWTEAYFLKYSQDEKKNFREQLEKFVADVYKTMAIQREKYSCVIIEGFSPDVAILQYCRQHDDIDFICISTRGAGSFARLLGTNTGNLITKSKVPVIAIPKSYKAKPFKRVLYAADFHNYKQELKQVMNFARPLKLPVEVLHFSWPDEAVPDKELIEDGMKKEFKHPARVHIEPSDATHSLVQNLQKQIEVSKPSLAIMFTDQNRTLFQKIFLSSKAEQLSFELKVPLLVFNKN